VARLLRSGQPAGSGVLSSKQEKWDFKAIFKSARKTTD